MQVSIAPVKLGLPILRKQWLAICAMVVILEAQMAVLLDPRVVPLYLVSAIFGWVIFFFLLARFGLLSLCTWAFFLGLISRAPLGELSAWYGGAAVLMLAFLVALAVYGFVISLAGRPLFRTGVIPQE